MQGMPLKLIVKKTISQMDTLIMKLFEILIKKLRSTLLLVETYDGWDGSNVRIIVKVKNDDIVEKIFDAIEQVEREFGSPGKIIPDIVTPDEARMQDVDIEIDISRMLPRLKIILKEILGDNLINIMPYDGWDGSNVRIIVKVKNDDIVEKIFDAIEQVEREFGSPGKIIPDIVTQNEL